MTEKTPLELAIDRAMRKNDPQSPHVLELDAAIVAVLLIKHWGDEAPRVLERALELARERVATWSPEPPAVASEDGG